MWQRETRTAWKQLLKSHTSTFDVSFRSVQRIVVPVEVILLLSPLEEMELSIVEADVPDCVSATYRHHHAPCDQRALTHHT